MELDQICSTFDFKEKLFDEYTEFKICGNDCLISIRKECYKMFLGFFNEFFNKQNHQLSQILSYNEDDEDDEDALSLKQIKTKIFLANTGEKHYQLIVHNKKTYERFVYFIDFMIGMCDWDFRVKK